MPRKLISLLIPLDAPPSCIGLFVMLSLKKRTEDQICSSNFLSMAGDFVRWESLRGPLDDMGNEIFFHIHLAEIRTLNFVGSIHSSFTTVRPVCIKYLDLISDMKNAEEEVFAKYQKQKMNSRRRNGERPWEDKRVWAFVRNGRWWWHGWVFKVKHKYAFHGRSLV